MNYQTLYKDAVGDPGNGIAPVSSTWAKKFILGMSDEEIKLDLQQQRFEKAVSTELAATPEVIKKTGVFTKVDKLYGEPPTAENTAEEPGLDSGSEDVDDFDMGGPETEAPGAGEEITEPVPAAEGFKVERSKDIIMENKGLTIKGLDEVMSRTNKTIDNINKEVESLLED